MNKAAQVAFFMSYTFTIYNSVSELPLNWNTVIGNHNIMLSQEYFNVLEKSAPNNMQCYFMGFFKDEELIGGALFQYLNFQYHSSFQKNQVCCSIRNFFTKRLGRDVMILGNNMLTGQNGFYFDFSEITPEQIIPLLDEAVEFIQKRKRRTALIIYKDYQAGFINYFQGKSHRTYFRFSVQPNMILRLRKDWLVFEDYLNAFSTKYRTRAKTAKKKLQGIEKRELSLEEVRKYQAAMNLLYQNVAENAPFNTFFLAGNHFEKMKEYLALNLKIFGYFYNERLIGFYTLILNNNDIDTYFLGYDKALQKEKQLYLNMLLDIVEFGIHHQFSRIIFGRTALEIKSTIGAEPVDIFGLIRHNNGILNTYMEKIFVSLNPKTEWIQRKPFK